MILEALATEGLPWIVFAALAAGLVRGFTGFGTGMVYLPVAGQFLLPFDAITTLLIMDLIAPIPRLPQAWRDGHPADLARLATGLALFLPLGILVLSVAGPELFRYVVSIIALCLLAALISGLRYRGPFSPPLVYTTGGLSGFMMGVSGLPGPPVILLYMASPLPARVIRANVYLYLFLTNFAMLPVLALFGKLDAAALVIGALMILPNLAGILVGAWAFRPEKERLYRRVAYAVIATSALLGLPIWG